jgi:hypothetical protein
MRTLALVFCAWALAAADAVVAVHAQEAAREPWNTFGGSWSAIGRRQTLPTDGDRVAATVQVSGTLVLNSPAAPGGLSRAFRAEAIGFSDGDQLNAGRAVWTDTRGDRVFSVLKGERLATGRRVSGTITGGTGRYAGLTGDWALTWQFVVETDEGEVQGAPRI